MKAAHFLTPLALLSAVFASSTEEKEEISLLIDEIIGNALEKVQLATNGNNLMSDSELEIVALETEKVTDAEAEAEEAEKATDAEALKLSSAAEEDKITSEIIPVEAGKKILPAPQNKFMLLFTSLLVIFVSIFIGILSSNY